MIYDIFNKDVLLEKAKFLSGKKFKPGYDGMSMDGAYSWIYINGERLCNDIINGDYRPMPAMGFRSAKMQGGFRKLSRLTAIDTILQTVLNDALTQKVEPLFSDNSFAFRSGKGVQAALERYVDFSNQYKVVAKLDFNACFENINHDILVEKIKPFCSDEKLRDLIMDFVKTPLCIDDEINETAKGLIQGMPLSPVLCNIYFHCADAFFAENGIQFIRYADDIVFFGMDIVSVTSFYQKAVEFFEKELLLTCNVKKCKIDSPVNLKFLGHVFRRDKKGVIAYEQGDDLKYAYQTWHSYKPANNRGRIDVISDGIMRQKDFSLLLDTENEDVSIPVANTNTINIYSSVIFDSGFLEKALKHGITVNIFDKYGEHVGSFYPNDSLKAPKVTHQQLLWYYDDKKRIRLANEFVLASVHKV